MSSFAFRVVFLAFLPLLVSSGAIETSKNALENDDLFPVSIIHHNDFHARFEETSAEATSCKEGEKCIGGYARLVTKVKELQKTRPNPIYLNAGDNFQGTLWYSFGRWNVTSQFLNMINADATTLGNHEFDHRVAGLVPFMENLESPIVVANIDDTDEPSFQGKYQKSIVIDRYDRKIGIIGIILSTFDEITKTDNLRFLNEEETIIKEAKLLKEQGVDIVIALTHCGLDIDYRIAKGAAPHVDVIVGAHSHTFMYTVEEGGKAPGIDEPQDDYPAVVETNGHKVLIVQASSYAKYLGDIIVYFDKAGNVAKWEGAPIYLDSDIVQDPDVLKAIQPWKDIVDAKGKRIVGHTKVPLLQPPCDKRECNLGNFVADALVHHFVSDLTKDNEGWSEPVIAVVPYGSLRTTLNAGPISYNDLATSNPFENTIDTFKLQGRYLKDLFEHSVESAWHSHVKYFLQISGARVVYNMSSEISNRVVSIEVLTLYNHVPRYEPVDPNKFYNIICHSYVADGGDSYKMIPAHKKDHRIGMLDIEVLIQYLEDRHTIYTGIEDRIRFV